MSFVKFYFTQRQINNYYKTAIKNFKIAVKYEEPEIIFHFCYEALLKLAIAVCADNGLRVKSRAGHHIELIKKLSDYLEDNNIEKTGDRMRKKRNKDMYGGGVIITLKEAKDYLEWLKGVFEKGKKYFGKSQQELNLNIKK
ncbi:hypothetical protein HY798_04705 [Candidatus Falkowbacteria bacterium]|nr:hypothetical protein [Candidatus Falkowbacteria bacterium]